MQYICYEDNFEQSVTDSKFKKTITSFLHKVPFLSTKHERAYTASMQTQPSPSHRKESIRLPAVVRRSASPSEPIDESNTGSCLFPPNMSGDLRHKYSVVASSQKPSALSSSKSPLSQNKAKVGPTVLIGPSGSYFNQISLRGSSSIASIGEDSDGSPALSKSKQTYNLSSQKRSLTIMNTPKHFRKVSMTDSITFNTSMSPNEGKSAHMLTTPLSPIAIRSQNKPKKSSKRPYQEQIPSMRSQCKERVELYTQGSENLRYFNLKVIGRNASVKSSRDETPDYSNSGSLDAMKSFVKTVN